MPEKVPNSLTPTIYDIRLAAAFLVNDRLCHAKTLKILGIGKKAHLHYDL